MRWDLLIRYSKEYFVRADFEKKSLKQAEHWISLIDRFQCGTVKEGT